MPQALDEELAKSRSSGTGAAGLFDALEASAFPEFLTVPVDGKITRKEGEIDPHPARAGEEPPDQQDVLSLLQSPPLPQS